MHLQGIFTFKGHSRERVNSAHVKEAESDNIWRTATVWHKVVSSSDLQVNVTFCQDNSCQKQGWESDTFFWNSPEVCFMFIGRNIFWFVFTKFVSLPVLHQLWAIFFKEVMFYNFPGWFLTSTFLLSRHPFHSYGERAKLWSR